MWGWLIFFVRIEIGLEIWLTLSKVQSILKESGEFVNRIVPDRLLSMFNNFWKFNEFQIGRIAWFGN